MSTHCPPLKTIEMTTDEQLIPFISNKLNEVFASWIQSNYTDLFTNYQAIFNAYNQLKSDYEKLKEDNKLKQDQIEQLTRQIQSTVPRSPSPQIPQNTEHSNEETNKLKYKIKSLETELISTQTKLKDNLAASTQQITKYQHQMQELQLKSDLNAQSIENQTILKEMNHQQTQQRYDELTKYH
eukprot:408057_1